jgi:hypothetical protein
MVSLRKSNYRENPTMPYRKVFRRAHRRPLIGRAIVFLTCVSVIAMDREYRSIVPSILYYSQNVR